MIERNARKLTLFVLIGSMILGGLIAICGFVWRPIYEAASVDVILTQEELRDPKLVEVVYRTHRENTQRSPRASGKFEQTWQSVLLAPEALSL
jgi:hypothetical protein